MLSRYVLVYTFLFIKIPPISYSLSIIDSPIYDLNVYSNLGVIPRAYAMTFYFKMLN